MAVVVARNLLCNPYLLVSDDVTLVVMTSLIREEVTGTGLGDILIHERGDVALVVATSLIHELR